MMNDGISTLLASQPVVSSTRHRRVCVDVRVLLVEIVVKRAGCIPSECIFARKRVSALVTEEVAFFQMYLEYHQRQVINGFVSIQTHTLLMSHQVCLPAKSATAVLILALMRLVPMSGVRLHVCLEVVGTLE